MAQERATLVESRVEARQLRSRLLETEQAAIEEQYVQTKGMRLAAAACGFTIAAVVVLCLIGTLTGWPVLGAFSPGPRALVPSGIISLALIAAAILASSLPRRIPHRLIAACGAIVELIAVLRLVEYASGSEWNVSGLFLFPVLPATPFIHHYYSVGGATAFALLALCLILLARPSTRPAALVVAPFATALATAFLLGYAYGRPLLQGSEMSPVVLPAALGLMVSGIGLTVVAAAWERAVRDLMVIHRAEDQAELARLNAEAQWRAAELETVFLAEADGVVVYDSVGRIVRQNGAAQRLLNHSPELWTMPLTDRYAIMMPVDENDRPLAPEETPSGRALAGETTSDFVMRYTWKGEDAPWLMASAVPLRDRTGEVTGAVTVFADITRPRQIQEELRSQRDRAEELRRELQTIMDYVPVGIIVYDREGNIRRANVGARQALGMTEEMMKLPAGERFRQYDIVDERGEQIMPDRGVTAAVLAGQPVRGVLANFRKTPKGSVWVSMSGSPIRGANGEIEGIVAAFSDVTGLRQAQENSQQLADELEAILNSIADGVAVYDREGRVLRTNPAALSLLEPAADLLTMPWPERIRTIVPIGESGEPLQPEELPLKRALGGEQVVGFTMRFEWQGKLTPWLSVSAAPMYHDGEIRGAVSVFSDVSHLRQIEDELRSYRDHLERLVAERTVSLEVNQKRLRALAAELGIAEQRERQRLASALHDEVAQTLGAIRLHLSVLQGAPTAEEIASIIEMIETAIRESRAIMMELSPPILQQQGLIETLRWWGQQVREKHGLEVNVEVEGAMQRPPPDVESTVFQMVKELLQNTVKYAQAKQATIRARCSDTRLDIEVADDGVGFNSTSLKVTPEAGFGLFSIRERLAYLGGEFQIDSAPGQGTRASLSLPLPCGEQEQGAAPPTSSSSYTPAPSPAAPATS